MSEAENPVEKPGHRGRQASFDQDTVQNLEKRLGQRPEKADLVERNILKDDTGIAPSLVAAKERLKRAQLEDKLDHALQNRPKAEELETKGILKDDGEAAT